MIAEYISNGDFETSLGYSMGFPKVDWRLHVEEGVDVKWLHGLEEGDISGRLAIMHGNKTTVVGDGFVRE